MTPGEVKVTAVKRGEKIALPVTAGVGWAQREAPCAGVLIEFETCYGPYSVFVPQADLDGLKRRRK